MKAAHIAFYGLQFTVLCTDDVSPIVSALMLSVAIQPILSYGCSTLNADRNVIKDLAQAKLLKSDVGLAKFCHNTPPSKTLALKKINKTMQLSLLRNAIINIFKAPTCYMDLIKRAQHKSDKNLIITCRCFNIRKTHHVSLMRYVFDGQYTNQCKNKYIVYHRMVLLTLFEHY